MGSAWTICVHPARLASEPDIGLEGLCLLQVSAARKGVPIGAERGPAGWRSHAWLPPLSARRGSSFLLGWPSFCRGPPSSSVLWKRKQLLTRPVSSCSGKVSPIGHPARLSKAPGVRFQGCNHVNHLPTLRINSAKPAGQGGVAGSSETIQEQPS